MTLRRWIAQLFGRPTRPIRTRRRPPLSFDDLEQRVLLSISPFNAEFHVNTFTTDSQAFASVATDAAGDFVVVWESKQDSDGSAGVYGQRYNAAGQAQGSEFHVNTFTTGDQGDPSVAMDAAGDFVVVWASTPEGADSFGIYGQRYNAAGVAQGTEFHVNTFTTDTQDTPSVAMDAAGDFVVVWQSHQEGAAGAGAYGIYGQRYNAAGVAQGSEFHINTFTTNPQRDPSVAMDAAGDFVVVWGSQQDSDGSYGIYGQRFNAAGVAQGTEFHVNTFTTGTQAVPSVAVDAAGAFVVVWSSDQEGAGGFGIFGQRYNAAGQAQGSEFHVNTFTTDLQNAPSVAMDAAGAFVVVWHSNQEGPGSYGIYGQRYNAAGQAQGSEFHVNTFTTNNQTYPSVAVDAAGAFVVVWDSVQDSDGSRGIYAQQYQESAPTAGPIVAQVFSSATPLDPGSQITESQRLLDPAPGLKVVFSENMATTGAGSVTDVANWQLTRNGIDITSQITSISFAFDVTARKWVATLTLSSPLGDGNYALTARHSLQDAHGNYLDGAQLGSGFATDFTRLFTIARPVAVGSEFHVNTFTTDEQKTPRVALDAAGDYVVVWQSAQEGDGGIGIFGQRYNAAGQAQGSEFHVNTFTTNRQEAPSVAMDAAGDFVVVWVSRQEGAGTYGIYGQRYNAAGEAQDSEFHVNTFTTDFQNAPSVAMDAAGDFVVVWQSRNQTGDSAYGIYGQRYNKMGEAQGSEFHVNTFTTSNQLSSSVAVDAAGDFVVVWQSKDQTGDSNYGLYGQRYNAAGEAQGSEFHVNTFTTNNQLTSSVAVDATGDFVVVWSSDQEGAGGYGIYGQRYNAAGQAQGSEFHVNTFTANTQARPSVALNAVGGYVVVWQSQNQTGDPLNGIYGQRYNAAGLAQGSEFHVNTFTTANQLNLSVAVDAAGDFVVAWISTQDSDGSNGIYAQRYARTTVVEGVQAAGQTRFIVPGGTLVETVPAANALAVVFSRDLSQVGGSGGANSVTNPANWALAVDPLGDSATITGITFGFNADTQRFEAVLTLSGPLTQGDYTLMAQDTIQDANGNFLDGDFDGTFGGAYTLSFIYLTDSSAAPIGPAITAFDVGTSDILAADAETTAQTDRDADLADVLAGGQPESSSAVPTDTALRFGPEGPAGLEGMPEPGDKGADKDKVLNPAEGMVFADQLDRQPMLATERLHDVALGPPVCEDIVGGAGSHDVLVAGSKPAVAAANEDGVWEWCVLDETFGRWSGATEDNDPTALACAGSNGHDPSNLPIADDDRPGLLLGAALTGIAVGCLCEGPVVRELCIQPRKCRDGLP